MDRKFCIFEVILLNQTVFVVSHFRTGVKITKRGNNGDKEINERLVFSSSMKSQVGKLIYLKKIALR